MIYGNQEEIRYFLIQHRKNCRFGSPRQCASYVLDMETMRITKYTFEELEKLCEEISKRREDAFERGEHIKLEARNFMIEKEYVMASGEHRKWIEVSHDYNYQTFIRQISKKVGIYSEEFVRIQFGKLDMMFWCQYGSLLCNGREIMVINEDGWTFSGSRMNLWISENPLNILYMVAENILCVSLRLIVKEKGILYDRKYEMKSKFADSIILVTACIDLNSGEFADVYVKPSQ